MKVIVEPGTGYKGDQYRVLAYGEGPAPYRQTGWWLQGLYSTLEAAQASRDSLIRKGGRVEGGRVVPA